jgi:hypothetical protein
MIPVVAVNNKESAKKSNSIPASQNTKKEEVKKAPAVAKAVEKVK